MGDLLNFTSDNGTIVQLLENGIHFSPVLLRNFNIQKGNKFPVIVEANNPKVFMLSWGINPPANNHLIESNNTVKLTHIYTPSITKQESLKKLILKNRLVIPVNRFVQQNINGTDLKLKHRDNKVLFMAGLWQEGQNGEAAFALLTVDVKNNTDLPFRRTPLFLDSGNAVNEWLNPQTKIFDFLDSTASKNGLIEVEAEPDMINNDLK